MRVAKVALMVLAFGAAEAPALRAQPAAAFDGTWVGRGTLQPTRHQGARCGEPERNGRLTVQGGVLTMDYSPRDGVRFSGPVSAAGTFDITYGQHRFQGRIAGGAITAQYSGTACVRDWQFRRGAA